MEIAADRARWIAVLEAIDDDIALRATGWLPEGEQLEIPATVSCWKRLWIKLLRVFC